MGISPFDFWNLTPYEFILTMEGINDREIKHQQDLLYLAWHIEAFARQKKLPKLQSLLKQPKPKKQKNLSQTELIQIAKRKGLKVPDGR